MRRIKIDPIDFPIRPGEPWYIVHPNNAKCEFRVPSGAITVCTMDFLDVFKQNVAYNVISADNHNGWVVVEGGGDLYEMPQYLFARHFDAEAFVIGVARPEELERARPFQYRPTLPHKPTDLMVFKG